MKRSHNHNSKPERFSASNLALGFSGQHSFFPKKTMLKGDTLVEIMFAVGIFGLVAIGAIGIMNKGLYDAQKALEITMARQEIDAQAEALRFIHEAYQSEQNNRDALQTPYSLIWISLKSHAYKPSNPKLAHFFDSYNGVDCNNIYSESKAIPDPGASSTGAKPFIINTRRIDEATAASFMNVTGEGRSISYSTPAQNYGSGIIVNYSKTTGVFEQSPTYPRLLFTRAIGIASDTDTALTDQEINAAGRNVSTYYTILSKAQGIWVTSVASDDSTNPEFFDFYIRTCWTAPGENDATTISTTIRLFNPDHHQ